MAKYIDAEKLIAYLNKKMQSYKSKMVDPRKYPIDHIDLMAFLAREYRAIIANVISLQQEQPEPPMKEIAEYYYHKGVYEGLSQGRADALKILDEFAKSKADPVIVIKQQEQPKVDLEVRKQIEELANDWHHKGFASDEDCPLCMQDLMDILWHFYELGKKDMKEQMLQEAVEGYVNYYEDSGGILMAEAQVGCPYHNGDKVRIIIVKEENK